MIVLAATTSTWRGGVAVVTTCEDSEPSSQSASVPLVLGVAEYEAADDHAEQLFPAIQSALERAGIEKRDVGLVACDVGPGSFTGVRAATSALGAIAWALGVRTVAVGSLEAMAAAHAPTAGARPVMSVLDAKRREVYFAIHRSGTELVAPAHVGVAEVERLERVAREHDAIVVGEFADSLPGLSPFRSAATDLPSAIAIATIALERAGSPSELSPVYVRAPDAKTTEELARVRAR